MKKPNKRMLPTVNSFVVTFHQLSFRTAADPWRSEDKLKTPYLSF